MITAYLGLGSNLGDRKQNLARALELLSRQVVVEKLSSIYQTEPVGYRDQPLFLNAVCLISTELSPDKLLRLAKEIEVELGRVPSFPNAPRTIDIDILFYGDSVFSTEELTIPHARLTERAFVLVPLAEIAPDLVHPVNGKRIKELLDDLGEVAGVCRWAEAEEVVNRRQDVSSIC
ncbi:MAG: 2-amino-4-hydroxy-6-hydroxymethyldihydropteridine diphosphokinase [Chloroflexi bacterium]|nr:2-amino-4-hydroxy-6-hydroxymethyldihydropteridine diphosphokinase [Chloroflexota bacterium]